MIESDLHVPLLQNNPINPEDGELLDIIKDIDLEKGIVEDQIDESKSVFGLIKDLAVSSLPVSLSLIFVFLIETINIAFVGNFGTTEMLAAIGIGTCFLNIFGVTPLIGLQGAVDTLCSTAYGSKKYDLVSIYSSISRVIVFAYFIIIFVPVSLFCEEFFYLLNQTEEVALIATSFVRYCSLAILLIGLRESLTRYLQSMLHFKPQMIITLITLCLHPFYAYLFIVHFNYKVNGAGIALCITQATNVLILALYIYYCKSIEPKTKCLWSPQTFTLKYVRTFLKISIPSMILQSIEALAFELLIIISSFIGVPEMSCTIIMFNYGACLYFFILGIGVTSSNLVGNCVGKANAKMARKYSYTSIIYTFLLTIIILLASFLNEYEIFRIYTSSHEVIKVGLEIFPYFLACTTFDFASVILSGINRGLGRQNMLYKIILFTNYAIGLPLSLIFVFYFNWGIIGLWRSQFINVLLMFTGNTYIFFSKSIEETIVYFDNKIHK